MCDVQTSAPRIATPGLERLLERAVDALERIATVLERVVEPDMTAPAPCSHPDESIRMEGANGNVRWRCEACREDVTAVHLERLTGQAVGAG